MAWLGITEAMRTTPAAAIEALFGLPALWMEAEAKVGI
jgi:hypothetical protein